MTSDQRADACLKRIVARAGLEPFWRAAIREEIAKEIRDAVTDAIVTERRLHP